jgi:hypothetical protein
MSARSGPASADDGRVVLVRSVVAAGAGGFNGTPPGEIGSVLRVENAFRRGRGVVLGVLVAEGLSVS